MVLNYLTLKDAVVDVGVDPGDHSPLLLDVEQVPHVELGPQEGHPTVLPGVGVTGGHLSDEAVGGGGLVECKAFCLLQVDVGRRTTCCPACWRA